MDKIEEKVLKKYKREISRIIKNKYRNKSQIEAERQKYCLTATNNMRKSISALAQDIFKTYLPIIEEEINAKLEKFRQSDKFQKAIQAELKVNKKKISCKSLKKFQEFEIGINNSLLDNLLQEINSDTKEPEISREEVKYILLSILYKIIDYLKEGYKIKIGTMMSIWLDQRDIRINLPEVKERILSDRLIPKIALGSAFSYKLFQAINEDNVAIINYYQAKMERFLMLIKKRNHENN